MKMDILINNHNLTRILEIGAGSLYLASKILKNTNVNKYDIYEKNFSLKYTDDSRINIEPEYFTEETQLDNYPDVIIHSHVLEHIWKPINFIKSIRNNMANNKFHCFIVPNLKNQFSKKYTNAIDFEHSLFIIEDYIDVILQ